MIAMGAPVGRSELATLAELLAAQWAQLRTRLEQTGAADDPTPSVLPGWTVAELVAHLGRAMTALTACRIAEADVVPLTLGEYLGTYPERADEIAEVTRTLAEEIRADPLTGLDRLAAEALDRLTVLRRGAADPVVWARRGPILLSEMVVSRLVELVVHGDDLARSLDRCPGPGPLDPAAVHVVAQALIEVLVDRGGWDLEVVDDLAWIRLATGRVPASVPGLAAALRTRSPADSVPDLGGRLPLL
jgi:uncharacterized protein (TIGR03083 family)